MDNSEEKRSIDKLGKFGLIDHITTNARKKNSSTVSFIGDDSAIIDSGKKYSLVSTDLLLEGIHFNLVYNPLKHLGYKSVIRAISDIYAMNGKPGQLLVSIGISSRFTTEMVEELYEGINMACEKYGCDLAGGDTTSSLTGLTIAVTSVGTAEKDKVIRRDGAKANDLICVTGDFGAAFMGLQVLERERALFDKKSNKQPDLSGYEYIIGKQLKPDFPAATLSDLENRGIKPTSMIDVSDGLASDLFHLCKQSGTCCRIYYDKIPVDYETAKAAEEFNLDGVVPALNGGEDYELLFTVPLEDLEKISKVENVKIIGHMTSGDSGNFIIGRDGAEITLTAQGWK